jgi:hypothetical protein
LQISAAGVSIKELKQGCFAKMAGLRDTLEPDPDNTGVGSFLVRAARLLN